MFNVAEKNKFGVRNEKSLNAYSEWLGKLKSGNYQEVKL